LITASKVKWIEVREKLDSMDYPLGQIVSEMKREIAFAEKARKEGPELLKKFRACSKRREETCRRQVVSESREVSRGSPDAVCASAKSVFGITMTDWVLIYLILLSIQSNTVNAESAHQYANTDHPIDRTSDSSPPYGFGESGGFGAGGDSGVAVLREVGS